MQIFSPLCARRRIRLPLAWFAALSLATLVACLPGSHEIRAQTHSDDSPPKDQSMTDSATWAQVDRLIDEQKYQAALDQVTQLRQRAQDAGDAEGLLRGLVRETQLQASLHGYEASVRFLRHTRADGIWPSDPTASLVHRLVYANSLRQYQQAYDWQIRQRERATAEGADLDQWTLEQITDEIHRAFFEAWQLRREWGARPVGEFSSFLEQEVLLGNDYPKRIRGTLRDSISHLWMAVLDDRSLWSPAHSNEIWKLDLDELLRIQRSTDPAEGTDVLTDVLLTDADVHPLKKIQLVLADLEAWHRTAGRPEAAFDARRTLIARLIPPFGADHRDRLRTALESALNDLGGEFRWWTMGQADLAEFVAQGDDPWALRVARDLAVKGRDAFPQSVGSRRCAHLVGSWELPRFSFEAMENDGAHRRSILVQHTNVPRLYFRLLPWDDETMLRESRDRFQVTPQKLLELLRLEPLTAWQVELEATPDLRSHRSYVTPVTPMDPYGSYVVVASTDPEFDAAQHEIQWTTFRISDLALMMRPDESDLLADVRSAITGEPLPGVDIEAWRLNWRDGHRVAARGRTGEDGQLRLVVGEPGQFELVASRGEDRIQHQAWVGRPYQAQEVERSSLIYTDRSIYRPGQQVQWKIVAFQRSEREDWIAAKGGETVEVSLFDTQGEEVATAEVITNEWGSASGTFDVGHGRALGGWSLRTSWDGNSWFQVEEYKRPTFEVEIPKPAESLRFGTAAEVVGEARYFFGAPVTDGKVQWRITRSSIRPPWWGWRMSWWNPAPPQVVASGETKVDVEGHFRISFVPEADPALARRPEGRQVPYGFHITATVVDPGGETREGEATLRAGFVTTMASIEAPDGLVTAHEPLTFRVERTNLEGAAAPGTGSWRLLRLDPPAAPSLPSEIPADLFADPNRPGSPADGEEPYRTEGDHLRPRWGQQPEELEATLSRWTRGDEVASGVLEHTQAVAEELMWPEGLASGAYVLVYETVDLVSVPEAASVRAESYLAVFGDGSGARLPLALQVIPTETTVQVGQMVDVLVYSGWADQSVVVEVWGRHGRVERRVLKGGVPQHIRVPATADLRGDLVFDVSMVRDHQELRRQTIVSVPWTDRRLKVELSSYRDLLRPGQQETWTVTVRDSDGEPLAAEAAEVLASMVDRSLDLFADHQPPRAEQLWPTFAAVPRWNTSVGESTSARVHGRPRRVSDALPRFSEDRLRFYDSFPVGGPGVRRDMMTMRSMAKVAMSAEAEPQAMEVALTVASESPATQLLEETQGQDAGLDAGQEAESPPDQVESTPTDLRSDFSETAFWEPHLLLTADGSVSFEFQVPDAVTQWKVWLRALTADFRAGSFETTVRTSKDLLVRPYLPRFFREGDRAELRVVVSNQGHEPMLGHLEFDIIDPETELSKLSDFGLAASEVQDVPFEVAAGAQTTLRFTVLAPKQPGQVAVRVLGRATAASGDWSDGELRPLPVLPSRLYLAQSRFVVLDKAEARTLRFDDLLTGDDPTRDNESLVMTLDGQLLTTVLNALPFLVDYPYSCTEQSLNRFVATGIVKSVFDEHPMVAELAKGLSQERDTQFEAWEPDDPNRKLLLEETPWLREARGGDSSEELRKILDPRIAAQVRDESLERVLNSQTASGAFPWWPGGPPSPFMTLYVLDSFARALEFGVDVPQPPVVRAWQYLETYFRGELSERMAEEVLCCLPEAVYLNWMLSNYPDAGWTGGRFSDEDRRRLLDYGFSHWRELSPRLKGYLALTLHRMDRDQDARLVWDSVMDSAKTDEDLGTYWAPEKMAWLWYNDTIESHAFALRVLGELNPTDERRSGLAQWLLVQKKLSHWKSTRATAEVIYSLVHYLKSENLLGIREEATVKVGDETRNFVFAGPEAKSSDRRRQWVIEGDRMEPAMGRIEISKETPGFLLASATWHFATDQLPTTAEGDLFRVERSYYRRVLRGDEWTLEPLAQGAEIAVGDQLEVQLDIRADHAAEYVHLRDPRGAGFEPEDHTSGFRWETIGHYREIRDSATNFFFEWLPAGQYVLKYRVRAATAGTFRVGPAQLQSMYAPEFVAYSSGVVLEVDGGT